MLQVGMVFVLFSIIFKGLMKMNHSYNVIAPPPGCYSNNRIAYFEEGVNEDTLLLVRRVSSNERVYCSKTWLGRRRKTRA